MHKDMIVNNGGLHLFASIFNAAPLAIFVLVPIWFETRRREKQLPFLDYHHLLGKKLSGIYQEYNLMGFI